MLIPCLLDVTREDISLHFNWPPPTPLLPTPALQLEFRVMEGFMLLPHSLLHLWTLFNAMRRPLFIASGIHSTRWRGDLPVTSVGFEGVIPAHIESVLFWHDKGEYPLSSCRTFSISMWWGGIFLLVSNPIYFNAMRGVPSCHIESVLFWYAEGEYSPPRIEPLLFSIPAPWLATEGLFLNLIHKFIQYIVWIYIY